MTANNICLISPIEQNKLAVSHDNKPIMRYFEEESIRMVETWRKRGGWLKDINIYFFNVNGAAIQSSTRDRLASLGCIFIDQPVPSYSNIGFLTEPLCGQLAEEMIPETILIKIDLDMCLMRPINEDLLKDAETSILIEQYGNEDSKNQRKTLENFNPFDTCFIISNRNSGFYSEYMRLCNSAEIKGSSAWKETEKEYGNYFLEEFVVDRMFAMGTYNIKPMKNHLYGEGYRRVEDMTDEEIKDILFFHGHIYHNGKTMADFTKQQVDYLKRFCAVKRNGKLK